MERRRGAPRSGVAATIGVTADARAARVGPSASQAAAQDRLGADGAVGLEPGDDLAAGSVRRARARSRASSLSSSTQTSDTAWPGEPARPGAADAMDVVLGDHRQLEVDDVRQAVDVEAARGDLGRDEDRGPAGLEVGQRADALALALVAVDGDGGDAVATELLGESIGAVLGAREDERLVDRAGADEVAEQLALALAVDRVDDLGHQRRRRSCAA